VYICTVVLQLSWEHEYCEYEGIGGCDDDRFKLRRVHFIFKQNITELLTDIVYINSTTLAESTCSIQCNVFSSSHLPD